MQAQDLEVLSRLAEWLDAGHTCHLCTIVGTYGSSPRPAGSLLALNDSGGLSGSLSGGCVEDDLVDGLRRGTIQADPPVQLEYGVTASDTERLGLPCGGTLSVIAERIEPDDGNRQTYRLITEALRDRKCIARTINLEAGARAHAEPVEAFAPLELVSDADDVHTLRQIYGPSRQLFLIGAGMVSRYLAEMAQPLEFEVTVCDPRPEMIDQWTVPGTKSLCAMPDDAIRDRAMDSRSAIIALTHDPRIDDMGLLEALETEAFYVGAMGSRTTSAKRRSRLCALGVQAESLDRLHAPVGIANGSKTPAEIAVSILAELTQEVRRAEAIAESTAPGPQRQAD